MNTADRNLTSIDHALRRRFNIVDCPPSLSALDSFIKEKSVDPDLAELARNMFNKLFDAMCAEESLGRGVEVRNYLIGHTYFMVESEEKLCHNVQYQLLPLLEEYHKEGTLNDTGMKKIATNFLDVLIESEVIKSIGPSRRRELRKWKWLVEVKKEEKKAAEEEKKTLEEAKLNKGEEEE
jgi:5-methylcytosine-specific restriction endonuclease McrBC GTP-binding regulatory subunit McrB